MAGSNHSRTSHRTQAQAVATWLFAVAFLVFLMILVGGATRLTDSGLSITEWKPILGAIPPFSEADWQSAFEKYKQIPEYKLVNKNISLDGFKTIFWWEWGHRFLGRVIGVAFALPFLYFLVKGSLTKGLAARLFGIFILGGLQGAIGWYMVMSGLVDRVDVSQYRLALHLVVAFLILGLLIWVALDLLSPAAEFGHRHIMTALSGVAGTIVGLLLLQVVLGAFVAGTKAGLAYNTWPRMNGEWLPSGMATLTPWYRNLFEDIATVQFNHRAVAYLIAVLAVVNLGIAVLSRHRTWKIFVSASLVLLAVVAQIMLGIWTLLNAVPLSLGVAHQAAGAIVFAIAVRHWHMARSPIGAETNGSANH
ncbi:MAG: COX15/CtaA family protein [Alphaproteobacteria bacterium]|nr:COX15/CtaA family protein [Alphaproteobacteria bacterium]